MGVSLTWASVTIPVLLRPCSLIALRANIFVESFYLEEPIVKFLCFLNCKLFLLLIPLCRPLVIRWSLQMSRVSAAGLDFVQVCIYL